MYIKMKYSMEAFAYSEIERLALVRALTLHFLHAAGISIEILYFMTFQYSFFILYYCYHYYPSPRRSICSAPNVPREFRFRIRRIKFSIQKMIVLVPLTATP